MNKLATLDTTLSNHLTLPQTHPHWGLAAKIAHLGDGTLIFGSLALLYWWGWQFHNPALKSAVLTILLSLIISAIVVFGIKYTLRRERPRDPRGFVTIKYDKYSFPSGHSARMSTLAGTVLLFNLPLGAILTVIALMIAVARVVIGIHYVSDVVTGLTIGFAVAAIVGTTIL